ncbi:glycosyltransferase family 2 protein [Gillisia sp. M10.2A]|uniref:Glycosyltransferase family 2 protein n=1 Tax=Gillisia lutea TaxID=2909668 RepID=A0ABS9EJS9_9FLAO|nr:glycosyltransferase family 2 protein [Gillisia lutea]MCF4102119.1 glycosyltransferase family 2 protein [Gillisia lutea]
MLISIIVTCYNQEKYISKALESILLQTYEDWECIVVDDGSTDNSFLKIQEFVDKDSRFKYFFHENSGVSTTRNKGIEASQGSYIQFLDGDDFLEKTKLDKSIEVIKHNSKIDVVFSNFKLYDDKKNKYLSPYCDFQLDKFNFNYVLYKWDDGFSIPIHTGLIKSSILTDFNFPENIRSKEDWLMWVYIFNRDPIVFFIDKPLAIYRIHKRSITMSTSMYNDHMEALAYLKFNLTQAEYENLLLVFVKRYYQRSLKFKGELLQLQNTLFFKVYRYIHRKSKTLFK